MTDLITLAEYKEYKQVNNPEKDALYSQLITSVSNLIKTYCGKTFIDHYIEPLEEIHTVKKGMSAIILQETPVKVVSAVTWNLEDITPYISIDTELGIIYHATQFTPGIENLRITYTGGYESTPADIKLAAMELVDYYAQGEHTARKTFGGSSVEYHPDKNKWPFHIQAILDSHRDV